MFLARWPFSVPAPPTSGHIKAALLINLSYSGPAPSQNSVAPQGVAAGKHTPYTPDLLCFALIVKKNYFSFLAPAYKSYIFQTHIYPLFLLHAYLSKKNKTIITFPKIKILHLLSHLLSVISRPGRSQGLLYKHLCASFIHSLIQWWFVKISLRRRHALMVEVGAFSHKID